MEKFSRTKWEEFARGTLENDAVKIPDGLLEKFSETMERIHKEDGEFDSVLWSSVNPVGTEDRTWVRVFAHLDFGAYPGMLSEKNPDLHHSSRIKAKFDRFR